MNNDYSELIEYLDQKFEKTATKEDMQDLRTELKGDIQGVSMRVIHIEEEIKEIKTDVSELKQSMHQLVNTVDKLAKAIDDLRIEYSAMAMQLNRHEKWIQQLAQKMGIKLEYE